MTFIITNNVCLFDINYSRKSRDLEKNLQIF